jgi:TonB-dependent receptor
VNNAWVRSESVQRVAENDFYQLTLALDQEFTDAFYLKALAGRSRSEGKIPRFTTLMYDNRAYNGFSYDYRSSSYLPTLAYNGADVTDGTTFFLTELRDQVHTTVNTFDTGELKLFWEIIEPLRLSTGVTVKRMVHDTKQQNRDGTICGLNLYDCDPEDDMMNVAIGRPGEAGLTDVTEYEGDTGPGSTTRWASPSIDGWTSALGYYDVPLRNDLGRIRTVEETTLGTFLQADGEIPLGGDMRLLYNAGAHYVQTRQTSGGYRGDQFLEVERPAYHDVLPSANTALWFTNDVVLRLAAARVMARPSLADLTPGGTADGFNYRVDFRNPRLDPTRALALDAAAEWYFAKESVIALAVFMKDIESFPLDRQREGTYASTGLPANLVAPTSPAAMNLEGDCGEPEGCWEINELLNGPGATVKGLEFAFQAPLSAFVAKLPPVIEGLGFIGNFTLVDSKTDYRWSQTITVTERLLGLSNRSINATLYYEDSKFGARLSAAHRSSYLVDGVSQPNRNGNLWEFVDSSTRFDFSSSYNIVDELEVTLEALNLTDAPYYSKVDIDANRLLEYKKSGRNFLLGLRYTQ